MEVPEQDHARVRGIIDELQETEAKAASSEKVVGSALDDLKKESSRRTPTADLPESHDTAPQNSTRNADAGGAELAVKLEPAKTARTGAAGSPANTAAHAATPVDNGASPAREALTGKASQAGFDRFSKETRQITTGPHMANGGEGERLYKKVQAKSYSQGLSPELPDGMNIDGRSGKEEFDSLAPRRDVLPGADHTLSRMDKDEPPEMDVTYEMGEGTRARLSFNEDDEANPVYTRRQKDSGLNSAGIYLDKDVSENTHVYVGGHHRSLYGDAMNKTDGPSDTGASVGFKVDF